MMRSRALSFDNGRGQRLAAHLDEPHGRPRGHALFAHCFTCSKNLNATTQIARAMARSGYAVLRFDFTGLGESEGELADGGFSGDVADLIAAGRFLEAEHGAPQLLVGHSLGGAAVLRAAASLPAVRAVATIAAPSHPRHIEGLLTSARDEIESTGHAEVELAGRRFTITKEFLDDLAEHPMRETIAGLGRPLLVLHSPTDETVPIDHATSIFKAAQHPKSFVSLDDADHLLTDRRDAEHVGSLIAAWGARYLEPPASTNDVAPPAEEGEVIIHGPAKGYRTEIDAAGHDLVADEPRAMGGSGAGPGPYELVLAGLGACTTMTLRMYADRKGWPLERADVRLRHCKVHAKDCKGAAKGKKRALLDQVDRSVELRGPLDDEQRTRLQKIANKCPVHKTLASQVRIETTFEDL